MAVGRATAIALAREGASVVIADIRGDQADETRGIIEREGGTASVFVGDLTESANCDAMVRSAVKEFGTLDILVNNIATADPGNVVERSEADWDRVLDISLRTTFLCSKHAVPVMADKRSGAIVNIGSISGMRGTGNPAYAAAKGGVHALTIDMAYAHGRQGVRVNAVVPGHITTPLLFSRLGETAETAFRQEMAAQSGLTGTEGNGWDVAWAALFLASDEARWITGALLPVDAGVMAVTPLMMAPHLRGVAAPDQ
jgi:NAD(P)-dependent dehydrogenase (short-subunit alcohol dehydrogenase family)